MARKKLTTETIITIQKRRTAGASYADLARDFRCSEGTIANALKRKHPTNARTPGKRRRETPSLSSKPRSRVHTATKTTEDPPTVEDLRRYLGEQMRTLIGDLEAATEPSARAAINRNLVAVQTLLSRITPPPADETTGVFVGHGEIETLAKSAIDRMRKILDFEIAKLDEVPRCDRCGQPIPRETDDESAEGGRRPSGSVL